MIHFFDERTGQVVFGRAPACEKCGWFDTYYDANGICLDCQTQSYESEGATTALKSDEIRLMAQYGPQKKGGNTKNIRMKK